MSLLIHLADPQSKNIVYPPAPTFQNNFKVKALITTGEIVGLAEWIIEDTCLVFDYDEYVIAFLSAKMTMSVKTEPQKTTGPQECAGCGKKIQDR